MEKRERSLSVQRRARAAASGSMVVAGVSTAAAASCADEMMRRMLDDGTGQKGMEVLADETPNVVRGDLLGTLGPIGPPLSFSPGESLSVPGSVKGSNPTATKGEEVTLGVKRVEVKESQRSGNPRSHKESRSDVAPTVRDSVVVSESRDVTGKGKGSGSAWPGVEPRLVGERMGGPRLTETPGVTGSGSVERYYIGENPPGLEPLANVSSRLGDVVNPFWSQGVQKEVIRETYGSGYDLGALGAQQGSNSSTPQKFWPRDDHVEMDAIELFRLRCLREAEEKFRQGLKNLESQGVAQGLGEFQGSQSSFASVELPNGSSPLRLLDLHHHHPQRSLWEVMEHRVFYPLRSLKVL